MWDVKSAIQKNTFKYVLIGCVFFPDSFHVQNSGRWWLRHKEIQRSKKSQSTEAPKWTCSKVLGNLHRKNGWVGLGKQFLIERILHHFATKKNRVQGETTWHKFLKSQRFGCLRLLASHGMECFLKNGDSPILYKSTWKVQWINFEVATFRMILLNDWVCLIADPYPWMNDWMGCL